MMSRVCIMVVWLVPGDAVGGDGAGVDDGVVGRVGYGWVSVGGTDRAGVAGGCVVVCVGCVVDGVAVDGGAWWCCAHWR